MFQMMMSPKTPAVPKVNSTAVDGGSLRGDQRQSDLMVPIRSLGENHRARIAEHLLALTPQDRYYRFGFAAKDEQVQDYAAGLNFERDEIFGIYNRRLKLIAMAHLAYSSDSRLNAASEFGVSVLESVRGRGYGGRLFERAVMHARNEGVTTMYVHVLSENTAMLKIARRAGAIVVHDGAESEAHLSLKPATFHSHMTEMVQEHLAQANYQVKAHRKHFWDTLAQAQRTWFPAKRGEQVD